MPRWDDVRPILVAVYDLIEDALDGVTDGPQVAAVLGFGENDLRRLDRALKSLDDAGYIEARFTMGGSLPVLIEGTHGGRQEVQGWPGPRTSTANAELLVDLLRAQADAPDTSAEQKTKVRAILDAIGKGGTDALSKVTAELVLRAGGSVT